MKDLIAKLQSDANVALGAIWLHIEEQEKRIAELEQLLQDHSTQDFSVGETYANALSRIAELEAQIAAKPADTDKLREAILALPCNDLHAGSAHDDVRRAYREGFDTCRRAASVLAASTALQAPVREVPKTDLLNEITMPDNWRKVAEHGNPPEGLYMAIYKGDGKSLPVALLAYGKYEFEVEGDGDDRHVGEIGWAEYSENSDGDYCMIIREVIAYLPVNLDTESLKAIRAALPAAPVQQEGE